ncbi:MAG: cyclophilin-like family protein [Nitrososphaerales archaeon]
MATEPLAGSVSRVNCVASFIGGGQAKVSLYRHLSPLSINAIMRILPIDSRINVQPGMCCLFTPLKVGVEKPRISFVRGDVAFLASGGLICVFVQEARSDRPLNPLGKVDSGLELFEGLRAGDTVRFSLSEPPTTGQS